MKSHTITVLSLFTATLNLAGCSPVPASRYALHTEQIPTGIITKVFDSKHNTDLVCITELNQDPPSITVLPFSRLDVSWVSVGPFGQEEVLVGHRGKDGGNEHSIVVSGPDRPKESMLGNTDANKDGKTDKRVLRFQTETGFIQYFDLDANGILDAQYSMALEDDSAREARILLEHRWVAIVGDGATFHNPAPKVTSMDNPPVTYQFQDGVWQRTEVPATPQ